MRIQKHDATFWDGLEEWNRFKNEHKRSLCYRNISLLQILEWKTVLNYLWKTENFQSVKRQIIREQSTRKFVSSHIILFRNALCEIYQERKITFTNGEKASSYAYRVIWYSKMGKTNEENKEKGTTEGTKNRKK